MLPLTHCFIGGRPAIVQVVGATELSSFGTAFSLDRVKEYACQLANWVDQSAEVKHYLREPGWAMLVNSKVQAGTLEISSPEVLALVANADRVREAMAAAGHDCGDLGPLGCHLNILSMLLNRDPLVRARAACILQVWADAAEERSPLSEQLPSLSPAVAAALPAGQRMTLRDASKSLGGTANHPYYQPLPSWPLGPARLTQRMLAAIADVGEKCVQSCISLHSGGKYHKGRLNGMGPAEKLAFGTAIAAMHGTEEAEVAAMASLHARGGVTAVLQHMRTRDGVSGVWGWERDRYYQPDPLLLHPLVVTLGLAEAFVLTNDWPGRVTQRGGRRAVLPAAAAVPQLGAGAAAAAVEVAYSLYCDDGGNKGGPVRQALLMETAAVICPIGERVVQRWCRDWRTSVGEHWNSAPWTVSLFGVCVYNCSPSTSYSLYLYVATPSASIHNLYNYEWIS